MPVQVKICGVCSVEDARAAVAAGADFLGLNFHPQSPRCVTMPRAREIVAAAGATPLVGVFVDASRARVDEVARGLGLAVVQFHGRESPAYCRGWTWQTIKALHARPGVDLGSEAARYRTDWLLIDAFVPGQMGGTGVAIDPAVAAALPADRLFVAGGLRPETVADVVAAHPSVVEDYRRGKKQAAGFLVGQVMKATHGKANPQVVNRLLAERLGAS